MPSDVTAQLRPTVSGKFFCVGTQKFFPKGVSYGPFQPNGGNEWFPEPGQVARDFGQIRRLGANLIRVYHTPPRWLLDLAHAQGLKLLIDVPWSKHLCFLDSEVLKNQARAAVREAVTSCAKHPAVFAYSVVNEVPPDVVRWSGADAIEAFLDELIEVAKEVDPDCLCTFGNFPPTEFLRPRNVDFFCFNVYLHRSLPYENYLARLQMLADSKPLILGEIGIDSLSEGEAEQAEMLGWQIELAFRGGLAGAIVYSFTDEWFKDGRAIEGWAFGLTTRQRQPKPAFAVVENRFKSAPYFPLSRYPKVSVVVACYNGARTLQACLESLVDLNYPDYEVIVVDDGSTDASGRIACSFKNVRYIHQAHQGLSVGRNTGIAAAQGEVVAFTDADCRADADWLYYLVGSLVKSPFVGIGGHNFLPPDDSAAAAAVMVSPGGPAHVMLTDRVAEHIPGCNMAFYKWALEEIGGFDPIFETAGDDVDVCWRLQQRGYKIGFSPAGFVWHYRRSTVRAYLKQQIGYGEAEALLARRHPEYFNSYGGNMWRGRIYTGSKFGVTVGKPVIYHGLFATGFFQSIYPAEPSSALMLCTSLEYHAVASLPLLVLSVPFPDLLPLAITAILMPIIICITAGLQADLPKQKRRFWSRPLVAMLFFLQPICRGWARYKGRLSWSPTPQTVEGRFLAAANQTPAKDLGVVEYWGEGQIDRPAFVKRVMNRLDEQGWDFRSDAGFCEYDIDIFGNRWAHLQVVSVLEPHQGKHLLKCRLKTTWSLLAKVGLCSILAVELLVIGFVGPKNPWLWLLLLSLPVFVAYLKHEQRNLQRWIAVLLDSVAEKSGMQKINRTPAGVAPAQAPVAPESKTGN